MRQHDYDIILGQSLNAFGLERLLASRGFVEYVADDGNAATGLPAFRASGYTWHLYDLDPQGLFISCQFGSQALVQARGRRINCQGLRVCFYLKLEELLSPGAYHWVEVLNTVDDSDVDEVLGQRIKDQLQKKLLSFKPMLADMFLKPERRLDQELHHTVTSTVAFIQKNERDLYRSYLCVGQMLDQRQAPSQYGFSTSLTRDSPTVICRISPYAYLKLGLYVHLTTAYPDVEFVFNETGTECRLASKGAYTENAPADLRNGNFIHLNPKDVQHKMPHHVDSATVTELAFAVRKEHVTVACRGQIELSHLPVTLGRASLWEMLQPFETKKVYTTYVFDTKSYFELAKNSSGVLDVIENELLREEHNTKHVQGSALALVNDKEALIVGNMILHALSFLVPAALTVSVANPILGCVLYGLCNATAQLVERYVKAGQKAARLREVIALHSLQLSFAEMLPFQVPTLEIDQFRFDDGLLLTARRAN